MKRFSWLVLRDASGYGDGNVGVGMVLVQVSGQDNN